MPHRTVGARLQQVRAPGARTAAPKIKKCRTGATMVDFGCAAYFQGGAAGDEDYSYRWFCNCFYISMTCKATVAALRSDPSVSAAVSSNQLLNPRELNESVALAVHGAHPPLHTGNCSMCMSTWQQDLQLTCSRLTIVLYVCTIIVYVLYMYNHCTICVHMHCTMSACIVQYVRTINSNCAQV